MLRSVLLASAPLAQLATLAIISFHVFFARRLSEIRTVEALSIASAALEAAAFILISCLFLTHVLSPVRRLLGRRLGIVFGVSTVTSTLAAVISVATLIYLTRVDDDESDDLSDVDRRNILLGASLALGLAFAFQFVFLFAQYVLLRANGFVREESFNMTEDSSFSPSSYVKTIRYSQTAPLENPPRGNSLDSRYAPSMTSSLASSVTNMIRPMSSKTRLLSMREKRRAPSLESTARRTSNEDAFDSWDTSTVDTFTRQTVLEASSPSLPKGRFLETIPASPTISRTPSPAILEDLEPPRAVRRSRSYSPVARTRERSDTNSSNSELHIHPLFRSDSPTPPPLATPGTVVLASPNAGQLLKSRQSVHSLKRMRSGSLPAAPSPLSRQGSFEGMNSSSSSLKKPVNELVEEEEEEGEEYQGTSGWERGDEQSPNKAQLAIPDWVLGAGRESSPTGDHIRRSRGDAN